MKTEGKQHVYNIVQGRVAFSTHYFVGFSVKESAAPVKRAEFTSPSNEKKRPVQSSSPKKSKKSKTGQDGTARKTKKKKPKDAPKKALTSFIVYSNAHRAQVMPFLIQFLLFFICAMVFGGWF